MKATKTTKTEKTMTIILPNPTTLHVRTVYRSGHRSYVEFAHFLNYFDDKGTMLTLSLEGFAMLAREQLNRNRVVHMRYY